MASEKIWFKSYDKHVPKTLQYPTEDLGTLMTKAMEKYKDRIGIYFYDNEILFKDVLDKSRRFATFLQKNGLKKGDVVAMNLPNTPQYIFALYGTYIAGGTSTGLSPLLSPTEYVYQLNDCKAKFVVTLDIVHEKIFSKIIDKLPHLQVFFPQMSQI